PYHALGHHDHVGPAGPPPGGAGADAGQWLQERGRGHAVVEGADDRHPGRVDDPLEAHRRAHLPGPSLLRHVNLLPGPRRTTEKSNASARWNSWENSRGTPSVA